MNDLCKLCNKPTNKYDSTIFKDGCYGQSIVIFHYDCIAALMRKLKYEALTTCRFCGKEGNEKNSLEFNNETWGKGRAHVECVLYFFARSEDLDPQMTERALKILRDFGCNLH